MGTSIVCEGAADGTLQNVVTVRGAFDIGSSQHKLVVAEVERRSDGGLFLGKILFSEQIQVRLNQGLLESGGTRLPDEVLAESKAALLSLTSKGTSIGATEFVGIATAVFRRAQNGADYLNQVSSELGLRLDVVTQDLEGEIGFLTASALTRDVSREHLLSWDSGGGSYQIAALVDGDIKVHQGPIGDADMMKAAASIQGKAFYSGISANPMSEKEAAKLIQQTEVLIQGDQSRAGPWLTDALNQKSARIVGFGFHTSVFRACFDATGKWRYTQEDVWAAVQRCCGLSDNEVSDLLRQTSSRPQKDLYPEVEMVVPKLVLVLTVMRTVGVSEVTYREANGSCAGVLLSERLWNAR